MKRRNIIVGFILLLCCFTIFGLYDMDKLKEDVVLKNRIIETVGNSNQIDFSEITDFQWDKMYLFTPYSIPNDILKKDGIRTKNSRFNIEVSDTINMIGFTKAGKLVAFVEVPRSYGGADLNNYIKFNQEESKFNIWEKAIVFDKTPENTFDAKEAYYDSIKDKEGFCIEDGILYAYLGQKREITIPETVTEIYDSALSGDFKHGENLLKVIVPGTVKKIDNGAFAFTAAKKIVVEEGVEEIETQAFMDSYIDEIWFPSSLNKIGNGIMETEEGLDGTKIHVPRNSMISQYFQQAMPYGNAELIYE